MSPRSISNALNNINDSSSQHNLTDRLCRPADSFNPSSGHYQVGVSAGGTRDISEKRPVQRWAVGDSDYDVFLESDKGSLH